MKTLTLAQPKEIAKLFNINPLKVDKVQFFAIMPHSPTVYLGYKAGTKSYLIGGGFQQYTEVSTKAFKKLSNVQVDFLLSELIINE